MRAALIVVAGIVSGHAAVAAQSIQPRSMDYLFASSVSDVRALWVNPAGLSVVTEASIMGEFMVDWARSDQARLGQWTLGFNSRGIAFAYQRDRHPDVPATASDESSSTSAYRLGIGLPFRHGSFGGSVSMNRGGVDGTQFGFDLGLTYFVTTRTPVAAVVRNLGRPVAHLTQVPISATVSASWMPAQNVLEVSGEATFVERVGGSGWGAQYRAGAHFSPARRIPVTLHTAADFSSSFALNQWVLGVSVGRQARGVLIGSGSYRSSELDLQGLSATALVSGRTDRRTP